MLNVLEIKSQLQAEGQEMDNALVAIQGYVAGFGSTATFETKLNLVDTIEVVCTKMMGQEHLHPFMKNLISNQGISKILGQSDIIFNCLKYEELPDNMNAAWQKTDFVALNNENWHYLSHENFSFKTKVLFAYAGEFVNTTVCFEFISSDGTTEVSTGFDYNFKGQYYALVRYDISDFANVLASHFFQIEAPKPTLSAVLLRFTDSYGPFDQQRVIIHFKTIIDQPEYKDALSESLFSSITNKWDEITFYLLNANVDALKYNSLLSKSIFFSNLFAVESLLALGIDVNGENDIGNTPIYSFRAYREFGEVGGIYKPNPESEEVLRRIIAAGANINHQNHAGITPLMNATSSDAMEVTISLLMTCAVDINLLDANGESLLDYYERYLDDFAKKFEAYMNVEVPLPISFFDDLKKDMSAYNLNRLEQLRAHTLMQLPI